MSRSDTAEKMNMMREHDNDLIHSFSTLWVTSVLNKEEKYAHFSTIAKSLSTEVLNEYYELRFFDMIDSEEMPDIISGERAGIQRAVRSLLRDDIMLDEYARSLWDLRDSFKDKRKLMKFFKDFGFMTSSNSAPNFAIPKSVKWHIDLHDENGAKIGKDMMEIDLIDSSLTDVFVNIMLNDNNYGVNGKSFNIFDVISKPSSTVAAHLIAPLPSDSSLMEFSKATVDKFVQPAKPGDILMSVCNRKELQILALQLGGSSRADFVKVGKIRGFVEETSYETAQKYLRIRITKADVEY